MTPDNENGKKVVEEVTRGAMGIFQGDRLISAEKFSHSPSRLSARYPPSGQKTIIGGQKKIPEYFHISFAKILSRHTARHFLFIGRDGWELLGWYVVLGIIRRMGPLFV